MLKLKRAKPLEGRALAIDLPYRFCQHTACHLVEQFLQMDAEPTGKGTRPIEAMISPNIDFSISVVKLLGDESFDELSLSNKIFFFCRAFAPKTLIKA
jgi:hypothetical protein